MDLSSAVWRRSTFSQGNACVEVAFIEGCVVVRDSKDQHGPMLLFSAREWEAFIAGVGAGEFNEA
jgi:Domain of unknown function (DUF397)